MTERGVRITTIIVAIKTNFENAQSGATIVFNRFFWCVHVSLVLFYPSMYKYPKNKKINTKSFYHVHKIRMLDQMSLVEQWQSSAEYSTACTGAAALSGRSWPSSICSNLQCTSVTVSRSTCSLTVQYSQIVSYLTELYRHIISYWTVKYRQITSTKN